MQIKTGHFNTLKNRMVFLKNATRMSKINCINFKSFYMVKISVILVFIISSILFLGCSDVSEKKSVVENRWLGKDKVLDDFPYQSRYIKIYESHMHYIDTLGEKPIVLFVHGQPTWSYMWRKVIPHLEENFRVIAVDLIGYGLSGKPIIEYTPKDQISYLTRFIQNLDLKNVSLVMHDWGSYIGLGYAREKPNNIEALIFFESILPADNSIQLTGDQLAIQEGFEGFLNYFNRPGNAEKLTYEDNFFIEKYLLPTIDANEKQAYAYRLPFEKSESRKPLMQLLKHFPYKENPRSVLDEIDRQETIYLIVVV